MADFDWINFGWLRRRADAHLLYPSPLLRQSSSERGDGRDAHKPMKKNIMAKVRPIAVPSCEGYELRKQRNSGKKMISNTALEFEVPVTTRAANLIGTSNSPHSSTDFEIRKLLRRSRMRTSESKESLEKNRF